MGNRAFAHGIIRSIGAILLMAVVLAGINCSAGAQSGIEFESLQIRLWPEYDQPEILVKYEGELAASVNLPVQITLRIPRSANKPFFVGMVDVENGKTYQLEYVLVPDDDWLWVVFSTPSPIIELEYYDPGLDRSDEFRAFTYRWPADYTVDHLIVELQQPINSKQMKVEPYLGPGLINLKDHLTYYTQEMGRKAVGEAFELQINYIKPDRSLSAQLQLVKPAEPRQSVSTLRHIVLDIVRPAIRSQFLMIALSLVITGALLTLMFSILTGSRRQMGDTLEGIKDKKPPDQIPKQ